MSMPRKFTFMPYQVKHGKTKSEVEPYVRVGKSGQATFGNETLEKLNLNKLLFYRMFVDKSKRTVGLTFSEKETIGDEGWKTWNPTAPKNSKGYGSLKQAISVGSFLSELDEVLHPMPRLPIGKYTDSEYNREFYWFRIPYGDETPGGRKFQN